MVRTDQGPASYKEHCFRMMLIWAHGLAPEVNPVKELYEALTAIDKKGVAGKQTLFSIKTKFKINTNVIFSISQMKQ